jgi:activating signal cointegrator complex subunit 2
LEGTAPDEDALADNISEGASVKVPEIEVPMERRNVFAQDVMDLSRVHVGKKRCIHSPAVHMGH